MKVEYSARAIRDLYEIAAYSRRQFGDRVTAALETRIRDIIAQIGNARKARHVSRNGRACASCHSLAIPSESSTGLKRTR